MAVGLTKEGGEDTEGGEGGGEAEGEGERSEEEGRGILNWLGCGGTIVVICCTNASGDRSAVASNVANSER